MREDFARRALEIFRFQAEHCAPYAQYISLLGVQASNVKEVEEIPFLPIEIFRSHVVYCGHTQAELVFESSGTTGSATSRHHVASAALYERSFLDAFTYFYGSPSCYCLETLLPSYRQGSSLLYMVEKLRPLCTGDKVLLLGVTFALLEAAREGYSGRQPDIV
ncbi:MAG: acyltransferase, partial [Mucinivorans sp.]